MDLIRTFTSLSEPAGWRVDDGQPHGGLEVAQVVVRGARVAASTVPSDAAAGKLEQGTLLSDHSNSTSI